MVYSANLALPTARVLAGAERDAALRRRPHSLDSLFVRAALRKRVTGGREPGLIRRCGAGHAIAIADDGSRRYVIDTTGLPQRDPERAIRELEILAYSFFDYVARESICGRGLFVHEVTPEHGRAWLREIGRRGGSIRSERKARAVRKNGRKR